MKQLKRVSLVSARLGIILILLMSLTKSLNADSTVLYLDWKLESTGVGGHLTISGYPKSIEENQTYKIEITLTLEIGDSADLGNLNFMVKWPKTITDESTSLGYSVVQSTIKRNQSVTLISHWTVQKIPTEIISNQTEGTLEIKTANNESLTTTPGEIKVKFRIRNTLELTVPKTLKKGDTLFVNGNITPGDKGLKITLTYLKPNGTEIIRRASTDEKGIFNDKYVPDLEGTWVVKANWNGTENYAPSSSELFSFEVQSPTPIWLYIGIIGIFLWALVTLTIYKFYKPTEQIYQSEASRRASP